MRVGGVLLLMFVCAAAAGAQSQVRDVFECKGAIPWAVPIAFSEPIATGSLVASPEWKVIDIGVLYTPLRVERSEGGIANVRRITREYVAMLNEVFATSRMKVVARLVGEAVIDYTESGNVAADLGRLGQQTGVFAGWRTRWGADLLTLMVSDLAYGGGVATLGGPYAVMGSYLGRDSCRGCGSSRHTNGGITCSCSTNRAGEEATSKIAK